MAQLGAPPVVEYKVLDPDNYEFLIADVEEIPNDFYDPANDPASKATQFKWLFKGRDGTEAEGCSVTAYSGSALGRHPNNKLVQWCRIIDPDFNLEVGYASFEAFKKAVVGKAVRCSIKNKEGKPKDDGTIPVYNKVTDLLATKMAAPTAEEVTAFLASIAATTLGGEEIPF